MTDELTYPGNIADDIVGRLLGPDLHGGYVHAYKARYRARLSTGQGKTTVWVKPVVLDRPETQVHVDSFGQLWWVG